MDPAMPAFRLPPVSTKEEATALIEATGARCRKHFESGFYCAESLLAAVAEVLDVPVSSVTPLATGFCSGVARTGGACGAFTGGVMAIGLAVGRMHPDEDIGMSHALTERFVSKFCNRWPDTGCTAIAGEDISEDAGFSRYLAGGGVPRCMEVAEVATRMVMEALLEETPYMEGSEQ